MSSGGRTRSSTGTSMTMTSPKSDDGLNNEKSPTFVMGGPRKDPIKIEGSESVRSRSKSFETKKSAEAKDLKVTSLMNKDSGAENSSTSTTTTGEKPLSISERIAKAKAEALAKEEEKKKESLASKGGHIRKTSGSFDDGRKRGSSLTADITTTSETPKTPTSPSPRDSEEKAVVLMKKEEVIIKKEEVILRKEESSDAKIISAKVNKLLTMHCFFSIDIYMYIYIYIYIHIFSTGCSSC